MLGNFSAVVRSKKRILLALAGDVSGVRDHNFPRAQPSKPHSTTNHSYFPQSITITPHIHTNLHTQPHTHPSTMSHRAAAHDASRRLFSSGAIPRYSNPNIIVDQDDDAGYAVGHSVADSPLPPIALFSGWARYRRDNLHWSELEKWVETRWDVVRTRRANTQRAIHTFVRRSIGNYQIPDFLPTDRMFVTSEPEAVGLLVIHTILVGLSSAMDGANSIFDVCMRMPQRNYSEPADGGTEPNDRAFDRLFWLCFLKLRRVICRRDVEVLTSARAGVDWTKPTVDEWARTGLQLDPSQFPRPPSMLLVSQTCPPRGLSIPEPLSFVHFACLYRQYREEGADGQPRANKLEEIMQVERSVLILQAVMSERYHNKWIPVLSVGVIDDMCKNISSSRLVFRVGPEGTAARSIITECTKARLAPESVVVKKRRNLCEDDILFVPLDRLPQIVLGNGTFRSSINNARLAGTSVGVPLRSQPAPAPRERPVSVPVSAPLPSFAAVRAENQAMRSRPASSNPAGGTQPSRVRTSPAVQERRSTPTRPASVPTTPTAQAQARPSPRQPTRPSSSRDQGSSSTPAQPTATTTPPTTNPSRTQATTGAEAGSTSEITTVTDLGKLKVRFEDLYHSFPFFRDVLRPLHTPNKTTFRVRELLERFNGHLRTQDPRAPRQHRGGRTSSSSAQTTERARTAEAEVARLRARIDAVQRDRITELEGRGPERRGTSRGREEEDDSRRPTSRRRRNGEDDGRDGRGRGRH